MQGISPHLDAELYLVHYLYMYLKTSFALAIHLTLSDTQLHRSHVLIDQFKQSQQKF